VFVLHFYRKGKKEPQIISWYDPSFDRGSKNSIQLRSFQSAGNYKFNTVPVGLQHFTDDWWSCGPYICAFAIAIANDIQINARNLKWLVESIHQLRSLILEDVINLSKTYSLNSKPSCKTIDFFFNYVSK